MATYSPAPEPDKGPAKQAKDLTWLAELFKLVHVVVETFGWTGTVLISIFLFVVWYASPEQKRELIDLYLLGKGISQVWPIITLSIMFTLVVLAQNRYHTKEIAKRDVELGRIGGEKSVLQEQLIGRRLEHVKPRKKE